MDYEKGLSGSIRTSQRFFKRKYNEISLDYNNMYLLPSNIIWIDNYSKYYKLSRPKYYFLN
jgi:hypothetical protein